MATLRQSSEKENQVTARLLRSLSEGLGAAQWRLEHEEHPGPELWAAKGRRRRPILFRQVREPRRSLMTALLADAILRGRARFGEGGSFMAVVGAPLISEAMARSIEDYVREVAPNQPFGYVDERGLVRLHAPDLQVAREPARRAASGLSPDQPRDLFSDLNQWLLKVLVGRELPAKLISVPREPARSAAHLAEIAGASTPSVWRLFAALKAGGHLDEQGGVVRARELLARWRAAALRPQKQVGAEWIIPGRQPLERLRAALAEASHLEKEPSACLGLFAACDALGLGHVRGAPTHLYVRRLDLEQLERFGLALSPQGRPSDVIVRVARWPEALFRAAARPDGVPVADVLQCWLDVSAEPFRGAEQAAFIWRRVLGPHLAGGEPPP